MWKRVLQLSNGTNGGLPEGGRRSETSDHTLVVVEQEPKGARPSGPGVATAYHPPTLAADFEQVYQGSTAKPPRLSYGILKVAAMVDSSYLSGLSADSKRCALLMALDAAGVEVEDILQDAVVRQRILSDYEEAKERDMQNFEAAKLEENRGIQAELDRLTSQYVTRIQNNLDEVGRAQDSLRLWQKRKQQEVQRIADAAAYCVPQASMTAAVGLTAVLERASMSSALRK